MFLSLPSTFEKSSGNLRTFDSPLKNVKRLWIDDPGYDVSRKERIWLLYGHAFSCRMLESARLGNTENSVLVSRAARSQTQCSRL